MATLIIKDGFVQSVEVIEQSTIVTSENLQLTINALREQIEVLTREINNYEDTLKEVVRLEKEILKQGKK